MPLVSVIVPNYNHAPYLQQRLQSITSQTFQDYELILLDDCSTDDSREILKQYEAHPKTRRLVFNDTNSGSTFKQWQKGIALAEGEWIWIAESDDYCEPQFLSELLSPTFQSPNIVLSYCQSMEVDEKGEGWRSMLWHTDKLDTEHWKHNFIVNGLEEINKFLWRYNTIPNASGVIFKKDAFYKAGEAFTGFSMCGDWLLWLQTLAQGDLAFNATALNFFRQHTATTRVFDSGLKWRKRLEEEYVVSEETKKLLPAENRRKMNKLQQNLLRSYCSTFQTREFFALIKHPENFVIKASLPKFAVLYLLRFFYLKVTTIFKQTDIQSTIPHIKNKRPQLLQPAHDVYFYLHREDYDLVQQLNGLQGYDFKWPSLNWVWSTYYRLQQKGYTNIHLVHQLPHEGIVVMASHQATLQQKFPKTLFVVSTVADSPPRFFTHLNVVQNPFQLTDYPNLFSFPMWRHISHWPQPNLIQRDESRGDRFENICFFGDKTGLAPEIFSVEVQQQLGNLGLTLKVIESGFNDYSEVDLVLAVRSFTSEKYIYKPYSKLINGWFAGVPVIAGNESSFKAIQQSPLDFIGVANVDELLMALSQLKTNPALRKQMVNNGKERAKEFTEAAILQSWENLLFIEAQKGYETWRKKTKTGLFLFYANVLLSRYGRSFFKRVKKKFTK